MEITAIVQREFSGNYNRGISRASGAGLGALIAGLALGAWVWIRNPLRRGRGRAQATRPANDAARRREARPLSGNFSVALILLAFPIVFGAATAHAQTAGARVLIVYKVNGPDNNNNGVSDSLELAQYYATERNVPQNNLVGLTISAGSAYGTGQYGTFYAEMVQPIQNALQSIGSANIDVILLAGELPTVVYDGSNTALSVDSALMGLFSLPSASNGTISKGVNPYFDTAPGFDASPGHFSHSAYNYNGTPMYLVTRLGSDSSLRGIDQVDQSLYAGRYVYPQAGYYYGNAYVDSLYGVSGTATPYTDAFLSSQTAVQEGLYDTAIDADMNIAYAEHYAIAAGFPLKWENTTTALSIGDAGATFSDGSSALSAPQALFYGGWYNFDKYNNVFGWLPGSVACDLNSASYFGIQALHHGATAAAYVVSEPYLDGHQRPNILYYYLLNGYTFAEASALATPYIGWMGINEGDPLYAPMGTKSPVIDTQAPVLSSGYPKLTVNQATGNTAMSILVNNTPEPEVVTAEVEYGPDSNYGSTASSGTVFARSLSVLLPWAPGTVYHYRIILTDPAGNVTTTGDFATTPTVSMTAPVNGATVTGSVVVSANAVDNAGITGVQFTLDGANLGPVITGVGPSYSMSWDTTGANNGTHILTAVATNAARNSATSNSVSVTVNNGVPAPVISAVAASAITSAGATITWTTNQAADSQAAYGTTSAYGASSALNGALTTSHSVTLSGLAASTTYHYQVLSRNAQGILASSGDFTFTTAAAGPAPILQIHADASEVSGVTNGSVVTPGTAPAGFTGTVVVNGGGSVNFAPAEAGNGVYFLSCCANTNNAYYRFAGAMVGNAFNVNQGQVTFYLKSRYSFAQRQASAGGFRYAFDVGDGNGHLFYFLTQVSSGRLEFSYMADGSAQYYFVPQGTEDTLYGNGVILKVTLGWDGSAVKLYLNDALVKSTPYTPLAANWTAASHFDLGAYDYYGSGYDVSDDIIDEFTLTGPVTIPDTTPPVVAMTAPANGATVTGAVTVAANATDNVGVAGVQFQVDGKNVGGVVTGAGPIYSMSWDTTTAVNGTHVLTAIASDAAGNSATANSVSVTVNNGATAPVISAVAASAITSTGATITWTTDQAADSQAAYGTTSAYGANSALNGALVTSHSVSLSGLAASTTYHYQVLSRNAQGILASSGDFTFTTAAAGSAPILQIHADASEVSGVTNGSVVTPGTAPAGFTGTVVVNGGGSVNFAPAEAGNGVYFLSCCVNTNNAYYRFAGAMVGNVFNVNRGQVTFYLKSRYSFAQRQASAGGFRYAFDVGDGNGHLFYFLTQVSSGRLEFSYMADRSAQYYFVPQGTEDALYGNGVILKVTLGWDGSAVKLYLNDALVKSTPYTPLAANWTAASHFDLGAYDYFGAGYDVSDDIIDEFVAQ